MRSEIFEAGMSAKNSLYESESKFGLVKERMRRHVIIIIKTVDRLWWLRDEWCSRLQNEGCAACPRVFNNTRSGTSQRDIETPRPIALGG
jgi:hypothetical protein